MGLIVNFKKVVSLMLTCGQDFPGGLAGLWGLDPRGVRLCPGSLAGHGRQVSHRVPAGLVCLGGRTKIENDIIFWKIESKKSTAKTYP